MAEDMDMEDMDTVVMDIPMVGMVDTVTDTTVANDLLMPKPNPTTDMVDTMAEDTDTEDTEVMVDTVMEDTVIMVEMFSHDQVTRILKKNNLAPFCTKMIISVFSILG